MAERADIRLRPVVPSDLPWLDAMQRDPEGCRMAAVIPRSEDAFQAHWERNLRDPAITPRVILEDGMPAGSISTFPIEGATHIGYWIVRERWGRGLATRAIGLLLQEVPDRPIHARVARENARSIRALQRNGFVVRAYEWSPGTARFLECEEALLVLG